MSRNAKPIEFFASVPLRGGREPKIVRAFKHDELSDWCWHGKDFSIPFADVPPKAAKWMISHVGTMRSLNMASGFRPLTRKLAADLAAFLDRETVEIGMSQVKDWPVNGVIKGYPLGLTDGMAAKIGTAVNVFHSRRSVGEATE